MPSPQEKWSTKLTTKFKISFNKKKNDLFPGGYNGANQVAILVATKLPLHGQPHRFTSFINSYCLKAYFFDILLIIYCDRANC
jgi:hypothetical protein